MLENSNLAFHCLFYLFIIIIIIICILVYHFGAN